MIEAAVILLHSTRSCRREEPLLPVLPRAPEQTPQGWVGACGPPPTASHILSPPPWCYVRSCWTSPTTRGSRADYSAGTRLGAPSRPLLPGQAHLDQDRPGHINTDLQPALVPSSKSFVELSLGRRRACDQRRHEPELLRHRPGGRGALHLHRRRRKGEAQVRECRCSQHMRFSVHPWPPHCLLPPLGLFDTVLTTMPSAGENRRPTPQSSPLRLPARRLSAHRDR